MPPKTKFDNKTIVDAALEVAKEKGFSGITARNVANKLHSSVAPIYVNFSTIKELVDAVVQRVFAITEELLVKENGKSVFEKIGKASLVFAREYPVLFRELSLQPNPYMESYENVENSMLLALAEDEDIQGWTLEERKRLLFKMRVFQIGLSVMVSNNHIPSWLDIQGVGELLMEVGNDVLIAQQIKHKENHNA